MVQDRGAIDAVGELAVAHEPAFVVAVAVGVPDLFAGDEHRASVELEFELTLPVVEVGHDEGRGDARVVRSAVVARPGLAAHVPAHGRGFGGGRLVGFHLRGGGRGDPAAAVAAGVDRKPVGVFVREGEVSERHVVVIGIDVPRHARGHGVVRLHADEVRRAVLHASVRKLDLRSREAAHRRWIAGVVGAVGAGLALVGPDGVARAALTGGAVAADEGEADEGKDADGEEGTQGTHRGTCWP